MCAKLQTNGTELKTAQITEAMADVAIRNALVPALHRRIAAASCCGAQRNAAPFASCGRPIQTIYVSAAEELSV